MKFSNLNITIIARRELKEIKQRNLSFLIFLDDFLNVIAKTSINKEGKILILKKALNRELLY